MNRYPTGSNLLRILTTPKKGVTLGGREGSMLDSVGGSPSCSWFLTPQPNGWPTAPVRPSSVMERVRWLSQLQALSYADELGGVQLQLDLDGVQEASDE